MIVAIDYHDTITTHENLLAEMAHSLRAGGHTVYILCACSAANERKYLKDIKRCKVYKDCDGIELVFYEHHWQAPRAKLQRAEELGVSLLLDDRADTCALFVDHGIPAFRVCNFADKAGS